MFVCKDNQCYNGKNWPNFMIKKGARVRSSTHFHLFFLSRKVFLFVPMEICCKYLRPLITGCPGSTGDDKKFSRVSYYIMTLLEVYIHSIVVLVAATAREVDSDRY